MGNFDDKDSQNITLNENEKNIQKEQNTSLPPSNSSGTPDFFSYAQKFEEELKKKKELEEKAQADIESTRKVFEGSFSDYAEIISPESSEIGADNNQEAGVSESDDSTIEILGDQPESIDHHEIHHDQSFQGQGSTTQTQSSSSQGTVVYPKEKAMRKEVVQHIKQSIKTLEKEAKKISRSIKGFSAHKLNQIVRNIRDLKKLLEKVINGTYEYVKNLYTKYFIQDQPILLENT